MKTKQEKIDLRFLKSIKHLVKINYSNQLFVVGWDSISNLFARTTFSIKTVTEFLKSGDSAMFEYVLKEELGEVEKHCIGLKDKSLLDKGILKINDI